MDAQALSKGSTPKNMGAFLQKLSKKSSGHDHSHGMISVRTSEHNGHKIVIETEYRIKIDGKSVALPLMVGDDGEVHCHSLPNYQFSSAIDLVKMIIDVYPESDSTPPTHDHDHPDSQHSHAASIKPAETKSTKKKGTSKSTASQELTATKSPTKPKKVKKGN
jgi:hypothetical protein